MGTTFSTSKDTNCWALVDIVTGSSYIGKDKDSNAVPVMLFPQAYIGFWSELETIFKTLPQQIQSMCAFRKIKLI